MCHGYFYKCINLSSILECDVHCTRCDTNGAGKCDSAYCMTGYTYVSATQTCGRTYSNCCA